MSNELIIALISLVGGGVITFLITKHFRERKSLGYQIVSKMSLIDVKPEVRDKIKIDYDGKPVENIYSFKVRVINDGNVPVKNQSVLFEFDKETKVLAADYVTKPEREFGEIKRENTVATNEAKFIIGLLNPKSMKEQIEFNFITVDNRSDNVELISKGENLIFHEVTEPGVRFLAVFTTLWPVLMLICVSTLVFIIVLKSYFLPWGVLFGILGPMFLVYLILGWKAGFWDGILKK
ncbi:MAG: hypothetical protein MUO91_09850 [candidate division Zixibacteria bacterium]|nr:hypothetical protein [candidate division Zixibacteria bacterium]